MRRILVPLILTLAATLALGFAGMVFAGTAFAGNAAGICEPDPTCQRACREKARAFRRECVSQGHSRADCRAKARAMRKACVVGECSPDPTCEERCQLHGKRLLMRCIRGGGEVERCREEARSATEACVEENCRTCACPEIYAPVCGVDGMTYSNKCEAECAGARVAHEGPCAPTCRPLPCDVDCPHGHVTDSDGCPTCECKPPPGCEENDDCKPGQICRKVCSLRPCREDEPDCAPCFGVCFPKQPLPCPCPWLGTGDAAICATSDGLTIFPPECLE